jgi:hypothetical protein
MDKIQRIFIVVRSMPTPRCGELRWSRIALNPSQVGVVMDRDPNASSQFVKALNNL